MHQQDLPCSDNPIIYKILRANELDRFRQVTCICKHHNTNAKVYRLSDGDHPERLVLKLEYGFPTKVAQESRFLTRNQSLGFLPHVRCFDETPLYSYYIMEDLDGWDSYLFFLRDGALGTGHINKLVDLLTRVGETQPRAAQVPERTKKQLFQDVYIERLTKRLSMLDSTFLAEAMTSKEIVINGCAHENLGAFWKGFNMNRYGSLLGTCGPYPGDMHLEHVFVKGRNLKVIDPNGAMELPLVYDLGKILQTLHGCYDVITNMEFEIERFGYNEFHFHCSGGADREDLLKHLENRISEIWGSSAVMMAFFSEIVHFSALIAHHARLEREALALFLRTLQLLREYRERFA